MNSHFFTAPFYFAFIWFRVQGSGLSWRLRRLFLEDGILVLLLLIIFQGLYWCESHCFNPFSYVLSGSVNLDDSLDPYKLNELQQKDWDMGFDGKEPASK